MSLTAVGRFGGAEGAASERRRALGIGVSIVLHGLLLLGLVAIGRRAAQLEVTPVALELIFEASLPSEAAVAPAAPEPERVVVKLAEAEPLLEPVPLIGPTDVVAAVTPMRAMMPVEPVTAAAPAAVVPAALAEKAVPEAAAPSTVAVARAAELPLADIAAPLVAEVQLAAPARRAASRQVVARTIAPERHLARSREAVEAALTAPAAPAAIVAAVQAAPRPPVRSDLVSSTWQGALAGWIRARTHYPEEAKQRGEQGAVMISFTVARDGQVLDALLRQRSGSEALDQAALAMFRGARVPAFPPEMEIPQITISVPVHYHLEQ